MCEPALSKQKLNDMDDMGTITKGQPASCVERAEGARRLGRAQRGPLAVVVAALLIATIVLSGCGSSSSSGDTQAVPLTLSGNWQFTMAPPADGSFFGGVQGGFLQESSGSAKGSAAYAVSLSQLLVPCNSGSAQITGTISGSTVSLTAVAGTQAFTLTGTLSFIGTPVVGEPFIPETMAGTYTSTAGTAGDGGPCGTAQTGLQWSAVLVPPITGILSGSFQSAGGAAGLSSQDFPVSGTLSQAANSGASSAALTGTLNFSSSDYPCFDTGTDSASITGQISGTSVTLQIVGSDQSILGEIGQTVGVAGATGINPVSFGSAQNGYIVQGIGPAYLVASNSCQGSLDSTATAGDYGSLCVGVESAALGYTNACPQAVTLSPSSLTFFPQPLNDPISQQMTLVNTSGADLNNLALAVFNNPTGSPLNFTETDDCGPQGSSSQGAPFNLGSGASCYITIIFDPKQTCATGAPLCPSTVTATLNINENLTQGKNPNSETLFAATLTGTGTGSDAISRGKVTLRNVEHHAETH